MITKPRVVLCLPILLWAALSGCASTAATPATASAPATWQPGNQQPLVVGWQQYFAIQWGATPRGREALIDGYITNIWGLAAREVRVLVNGYDASGTQVGQLIAWGPNQIQPGDRVYFDVTVPGGAATYEVRVFSWRWTWPPSGHREESPGAPRARAIVELR